MHATLISLCDVWVVFAMPQGQCTGLRGITLDIQHGEWLCLVGSNGSGKSTLAKVIADLCPLSRGSRHTHTPIRCGVVFQNPETQSIGETVEEDIRFQPGLDNPDDIPVEAILAMTRLEEQRWQSVDSLSGGQKQRLAVASVMAGQADVVVFDEATAMLDDAHRMQMLQVAKEVHANGHTVVWVTQQLDEVAWADRVLAMEDGSLRFEGSPRQFFYPAHPSDESCCEKLGMVPPLPIAVARAMMKAGWMADEPPLTLLDLERGLRTT